MFDVCCKKNTRTSKVVMCETKNIRFDSNFKKCSMFININKIYYLSMNSSKYIFKFMFMSMKILIDFFLFKRMFVQIHFFTTLVC